MVLTPCPISGFLAMIVTKPSGVMLDERVRREVVAWCGGACASIGQRLEVVGEQQPAAGQRGDLEELRAD